MGCAKGDLELSFSKHAKKITMVEIKKRDYDIANKKRQFYECPVEIINDDFFNIDVVADVYFLWCGGDQDCRLGNHIREKYPGKTLVTLYSPDRKLAEGSKTYLVPFDERGFRLGHPNKSPAGRKSKLPEEAFERFKQWLNDGLYGYVHVTVSNGARMAAASTYADLRDSAAGGTDR